MRFTYYKKTGCHYRCDSNGEVFDSEDEGYDFSYEVDNAEALDKVSVIMAKDKDIFPESDEGVQISWKERLKISQNFVSLMDDLGAADSLLEYYYDDLREVFHDEAIDNEDD